MSRHASPHPAPARSDTSHRRSSRRGRLAELPRDPVLALAVSASIGAGLVHAAVAPEHRDWWASVAFFAALGAFQIGWAALVLFASSSRRLLLLGAAVNLGALLTWLLSRTAGMPFGPTQGVTESMARADVLASLLGAVVIASALALARGWSPLARPTRVRPLALAGAAGMFASAVSVLALTGVSGHGHGIGDHGEHGGTPGGILPAAVSTDIEPAVAEVPPNAGNAPIAEAPHEDDGHAH